MPAPPQTSTSSPCSPSSNSPAETRPNISQPASALSVQHQSSVTKNSTPQLATLRLRREMTQPTIGRVELVSSMDAPLEKLAANDTFPAQYRSNLTNTKQQTDIRNKSLRIIPSRLSADYFPVRHVSRTRVNDRLPSPKGKIIGIPLFLIHQKEKPTEIFLSDIYKLNSSYFIKI